MILLFRTRTQTTSAPTLCRAARGFTVLEVFAVIVLTLALVALAAASMDFSAQKWSMRPARQSLIRAVGEAHNQSRLLKEDLLLRYDHEDSALLIENTRGVQVQRIPLSRGEINAIVFYRVLPETERSESPSYEPEDEPVSAILFSASGSSTPTQIEIDSDYGRQSLIFDPFSLRLIQDALN